MKSHLGDGGTPGKEPSSATMWSYVSVECAFGVAPMWNSIRPGFDVGFYQAGLVAEDMEASEVRTIQDLHKAMKSKGAGANFNDHMWDYHWRKNEDPNLEVCVICE